MALQQYPSFRGAANLRALVGRLFDAGFPLFGRHSPDAALALDVYERDDAYAITASLPGVMPEMIDITAYGNTLTIAGETKASAAEEPGYLIHERRAGRYERSVTFAVPIDAKRADATVADGVLTLTLPKAGAAPPYEIPVHVERPLVARRFVGLQQ